MLLLLGSSGYVGQAFARYLDSRALPWRGVSRQDFDAHQPERLTQLIRETRADFLVNAAGYTGRPNIEACETHKAECLLGNAVLPGTIRSACESAGIAWGHVSTGCIYSGHRVDGQGFREEDPPTFSFRSDYCSFYSGSKALGEEVLQGAAQCYLWRLRIPFDGMAHPRNYLSKLMAYPRLLDVENSISHLGDFVASCLACHEKQVPYGTYNLTSPGSITTRQIAGRIRALLLPDREFSFFDGGSDFLRNAATVPRSNCVLDTTKSETAGIALRPIGEAIDDALRNWKS
jgi:dTDP-4-dehydrorhamnose reductase